MKIAIVGMGVAGISVLREWTKEKLLNPSIELTVFGDEKTFGTGQPYQEDNEILIMNQPAGLATIIPEDEDDFVHWLENTQGQDDPRLGYSPRPVFGRYIKDRMNQWLKQSGAEVIKERIDMISILPNNKFQLTFQSGVEDFDAVHLCIGNYPYNDPYNLSKHDKFIFNPFPIEESIAQIPKGARIGVLGTGLTSADIFRYTYYNRPDLKVSFFSRSGTFKSIRGTSKPFEYRYFTDENIKRAKEANNGFIPLETYIEWFKGEMDNQGLSMKENWLDEAFGSRESIEDNLENPDDIGMIQSLFLGMDRMLTDLWMSLKESDKQSFIDKYNGKWNKLRSTLPPISGKGLLSAWLEGRISVWDNLIDIVKDEGSFEFILKDQDSQHTDYIFNAIGTEKNISFDTYRLPLLAQLIDERILQPETFGGVQVSLPDLSAVSQKYGIINGLKVHGPLISGIEFGNNSVDIISESVVGAIEDILNNFND